MNILFISQYYPPEMGALASRASEMCKIWADDGHDVSVLTAFPNYPSGVIPHEYKGLRWKVENVNNVTIIRTFIYAGHYKGRLNRVLNYTSFLFSGIFWGRKLVNDPDIIIASSPPILVPVIGYFLSMFKKSPLIFEVRDLWPESIIQISGVNNRIIIGLLKKLEIFLYKKSGYIITVTESFKTYISNMGIPDEKIGIVKNGVDLDLYDPGLVIEFPRPLIQLKNKFIISYIGNHGMAQGLSTIIEIAELNQKNDALHFLFVGDGAEKPMLERKVLALNLKNVTFTGQISKSEMPSYYKVSEIILVPLKNLPLFQQVIPSKIFEIMAMKKAIVLTVPGEVKKIVVDEAKAGLYAEPENAEEMSRAILKLYNNKGLREDMGKNGRNYVLKNFNRKDLAKLYISEMSHLKNKHE